MIGPACVQNALECSVASDVGSGDLPDQTIHTRVCFLGSLGFRGQDSCHLSLRRRSFPWNKAVCIGATGAQRRAGEALLSECYGPMVQLPLAGYPRRHSSGVGWLAAGKPGESDSTDEPTPPGLAWPGLACPHALWFWASYGTVRSSGGGGVGAPRERAGRRRAQRREEWLQTPVGQEKGEDGGEDAIPLFPSLSFPPRPCSSSWPCGRSEAVPCAALLASGPLLLSSDLHVFPPFPALPSPPVLFFAAGLLLFRVLYSSRRPCLSDGRKQTHVKGPRRWKEWNRNLSRGARTWSRQAARRVSAWRRLRFDRSGYLHGLFGRCIPLAASNFSRLLHRSFWTSTSDYFGGRLLFICFYKDFIRACFAVGLAVPRHRGGEGHRHVCRVPVWVGSAWDLFPLQFGVCVRGKVVRCV